MNKVLLVISREYLSRVRKKSFIVMTLLAPLLFGGFFFIIAWTATKEIDTKSIQVIDESGMFGEAFIDNEASTFDYSEESLDEGKGAVLSGAYDGLLYIPKLDVDKPEGVVFYSASNPSIGLIASLGKKLEVKIESEKLHRSGIDQAVIDALEADVDISTINLSGGGDEKESSSIGATVVGYVASFLIYIFIFVYGTQIMRGVVEEKTSRIIEVMIASVRPFQLMMGKVIGIAGVGLSQFILWILLTVTVNVVSGGFIASRAMESGTQKTAEYQDVEPSVQDEVEQSLYKELNSAVESIDIPMVVVAFLFYFLTGYLLYGALFAAIGSAVDSDADAQQFMLPVTMPLIASIVILSAVLNDPNGSLAFWMSMIPFTSPVVMMMRVPFGVPVWELCLSMVLMIGGFLFTIWVASRIYRIGILIHGTKVNYKVLAKWFLMKN